MIYLEIFPPLVLFLVALRTVLRSRGRHARALEHIAELERELEIVTLESELEERSVRVQAFLDHYREGSAIVVPSTSFSLHPKEIEGPYNIPAGGIDKDYWR